MNWINVYILQQVSSSFTRNMLTSFVIITWLLLFNRKGNWQFLTAITVSNFFFLSILYRKKSILIVLGLFLLYPFFYLLIYIQELESGFPVKYNLNFYSKRKWDFYLVSRLAKRETWVDKRWWHEMLILLSLWKCYISFCMIWKALQLLIY